MKTFEKWKLGELHHAFNLKELDEMPLMQQWIESEEKLTDLENSQLHKLKTKLQKNAKIWNEDELKFMFISQLIAIVDFDSTEYKIFTQRSLGVEINGLKINGIVDFVLAQGIDEPERPYFFLHEYKQEKKGVNDPLAQLLAEMLVAQHLNDYHLPVYGCYVLGRFWFFVILKDKEYIVSNAFNASDEDIFKIVSILRKVKEYTNQYLAEIKS